MVAPTPNIGLIKYGVDVQPFLPKPNPKQRLHTATIVADATFRTFQVATASLTKKISYIGIQTFQQNATADGITIWDGNATAAPGIAANAVYTDANGYVGIIGVPATVGNTGLWISPLPIEVFNGIRLSCGVAGGGYVIVVYYLEEFI